MHYKIPNITEHGVWSQIDCNRSGGHTKSINQTTALLLTWAQSTRFATTAHGPGPVGDAVVF